MENGAKEYGLSFCVYILRCANDSYYTGHTDNLEKRLAEHRSGACGYTSTRLPVDVIFSQEFPTREEALASEQRIKGWSRKKKEAMFKGDWEEVSKLAKSNSSKLVSPSTSQSRVHRSSFDKPALSPPFILRQACPESSVHPSTGSGRTESRRAQDERRVEGLRTNGESKGSGRTEKKLKKPLQPSVSFIGAGPGDPELITVKGMKAVQRADVVIYAGSLVSEKILDYAKKGAKIYNSASMNLEETTKVIIDGVKAGKRVARVHTGDPSLYGAILEQIIPLEAAGISYEIISGVSSAFASAAYLKAELTLPEVSQTVIFTRVEGRTPVPEKERLSELAKHGATICIFLSVGMIDRVVSELLQGYTEDTPIAVVERASWPDERAITGTLKNIAQRVKDAGIKKQAMIIVGDVLKPAVSGQWPVASAKSKLYDKGFKHEYRK